MTELSTDRRFHSLSREQVQTLDQVLTEVIPIHGRGNFPTLEVKPKDIIHMVRDKLVEKGIRVRDVRLNGSTASHVLVKENGTSYKDLDIIFGIELPKQEDFQIIKEVVLHCLLDFLPRGVNKDKITALTMKEAYVQKMVKVFTEHDRWSLISLSNNSGKNVELKFVNSLRRQFEFSVDSFQIVLDRMLESYLEVERRQGSQQERLEDKASVCQLPSTSLNVDKPQSLDKGLVARTDGASSSGNSSCCFDEVEMREEEASHMIEEPVIETADMEKVRETKDMQEITEKKDTEEVTEMEQVTESSTLVPSQKSESQVETELMARVEAKGKEASDTEKSIETSVLKELVQNKVSIPTAISLDTVAQVPVENSTDIESIDSHSVPPIKETTVERQVTLKVLCVSPRQSCACLSEETQDTEYPLPPPAKKIYKNSQMVVLKHSSPKPPRKMSKKVNVVSSLGKTNSPDEPSVVGQILNRAKASSVESVPMVVDVTDQDKNHCKSPTSTPQHEDSQVSLLNIVNIINTAELHDNSTQSQVEVTSQTCEFLTSSFEVTSKSNEFGVATVSDKDQHQQIPSVEVLPPSPQVLELAVEIPESVELGPKRTSLIPEDVAHVPQRTTEISEFTEHVLESAPEVPGFTEHVLESAPEVPGFTEHVLESAPEVPGFTEHVLESAPEVPGFTEHVLESAPEVPGFTEHVLESAPEVPGFTEHVLESAPEVPEFTGHVLESAPEVPGFTEHVLESAPEVPEFTEHILESAPEVPEFSEHVLESAPEVPGFTEHVLESAPEVPGFTVQVAVASLPGAELPTHVHKSTAQTSNVLGVESQSLESNVDVPDHDVQVLDSVAQEPEPDIQVLESGGQEPETKLQALESDVQRTVPDVQGQILESDFEVSEPVAQCEKLQMEAASHNQEIQAAVPTRDLTAITVVAESMYGDFEQAMDHLRYRLIATRNPEEIRGGGLLKYSNLLVREFKPASETEIKTLERYMCSRFFIDFPDVNEQQRKIESYLRNHFIGEEKSKYDYLMTLRRVVNESTVCLMGHERRQTLNMITVLALKVLGEQNIIPNTTNVTCYYQPAPYMADHSFNNYYIAHGQAPLFYQPYPLHIHMQTGLV